MKPWFRRPGARLVRASATAALLLPALSCGMDSTHPMPADGIYRWYKGNTHTHTTVSDGDSPPSHVVRWYRQRDYDFLVLSDHNAVTDLEALNAEFASPGRFILIPGEEISNHWRGIPLDVSGLGIDSLIPRQFGTGVVDVLQRSVDRTRLAGGVPIINHPNFYSAISSEHLGQVLNVRLFELHNGTPMALNDGGANAQPLEVVWDQQLSAGRVLYGVAADDMHLLKRAGDASAASPGKAWVVVRAAELSQDSILASLDRGDFYSSTGVELNGYSTSSSAITVSVRREAGVGTYVDFIGRDGRLLHRQRTNPASYSFRGDEGYVRVRVVASNGKMAWTQPVFVSDSVVSEGESPDDP